MAARKPAAPKSMDDVIAQMSEQMQAYQDHMQSSMQQYEALVAKATSDLDKLVAAAATPPPAPPAPQTPECQWTENDSGKYLVMNVAAAEFFSAIFQQVGVLAQELQKMAPK